MTSLGIGSIVGQLAAGIAQENHLLRQGRVNDALHQSEKKGALLDALDEALAVERKPMPEVLRVEIERMLVLNNENASLLQAALAGFIAAKDIVEKNNAAAGYGADGRRVFPVQEKTKKHF